MKLKLMLDNLTVFEEKATKFNEKRPVLFSNIEKPNNLPELVPLDNLRSVTAMTDTHAVAVVPKSTLLDLWNREKISKEFLLSLFGMTPEDLTNSTT
jgi:hypothetical protein